MKILFDSYSTKAQNTTYTIRLLGYKYLVHFSVWTKCLSDGVENANTKLYTSFWRTFRTIPVWPSKNLFHNSLVTMKGASTTSILSQHNKACNGMNVSVKIVVHY